jgi:AcrR family transcriptional regulator
MSKGEVTKANILHHAVSLVSERGLDGVSMDAVAEASGMSKGAVTYHFPSKAALMEQICTAAMDAFEQRIDEMAEKENSEYPWIQSFLEASFDSASQAPANQGFNRVIASLIQSDRLSHLVSERYETWQRKLDREAPNPTLARLVRHLSDGVWMADAFDVAPMKPAQKRKLARFVTQALREVEE